MLENFESFSVDADVSAAIRNVQADFSRHVADEIRKSVERNQGHAVADALIFSDGEIIHLEGSDITHFAYRGTPLVAWTEPKMEVAGVTRIHLTYRIGTLPTPSEETLRLINETHEG